MASHKGDAELHMYIKMAIMGRKGRGMLEHRGDSLWRDTGMSGRRRDLIRCFLYLGIV